MVGQPKPRMQVLETCLTKSLSVDKFLSINLSDQKNFLKGHRFVLENILPINQDNNGLQMKKKDRIIFGWHKDF